MVDDFFLKKNSISFDLVDNPRLMNLARDGFMKLVEQIVLKLKKLSKKVRSKSNINKHIARENCHK